MNIQNDKYRSDRLCLSIRRIDVNDNSALPVFTRLILFFKRTAATARDSNSDSIATKNVVIFVGVFGLLFFIYRRTKTMVHICGHCIDTYSRIAFMVQIQKHPIHFCSFVVE